MHSYRIQSLLTIHNNMNPIINLNMNNKVSSLNIDMHSCNNSNNRDNIMNNNDPGNDDDEKCNTCRYTGVLFCTGLSLYFLKAALLDLPDRTTKKEIIRQKRFLLCFSTFWAVGGAYRWYLG